MATKNIPEDIDQLLAQADELIKIDAHEITEVRHRIEFEKHAQRLKQLRAEVQQEQSQDFCRNRDEGDVSDVAGSTKLKKNSRKWLSFCRTRRNFKSWGGGSPRGCLGRAARHWKNTAGARGGRRSQGAVFQFVRALNLLKCSSVSAPPACAICLRRHSRTHRVLFSSTNSMRSVARVA